MDIGRFSVSTEYNVIWDLIPYDEIDGIPLTPEILQKNGWKKVDCGWRFRDGDKILDIEFFPGVLGIIASVMLIQKDDAVNVCNIYYVHELQHLLGVMNLDSDLII